MEEECDYYFAVDSLAMLTNQDTLRNLMQIKRYNYVCIKMIVNNNVVFRNVIAPMIVRPGKLFSNFWGDIARNGFYARSHDYALIAENNRRYNLVSSR